MADFLVAMVFGFPAAFASLLLSVIGVLKEKYRMVLVGAVLFIPFSYYLSGAPGSMRLPLLLPAFPLVSALAVREKKKLWALALLAPMFLAVFWIIAVVLYYQFA